MNLPLVAVPTLSIRREDRRFPVRRVFCVGQNYADHAREMGGDPDRQAPFFFTKPADSVVEHGCVLPFPPRTADLHHEVELVVALGGGGTDIAAEDALPLVFGFAAGIDLTRRDLQSEAKKHGRPWDMAKGFDRSAPIGPLSLGSPPSQGTICLSVNGELRQSGDLSQMIWDIPEIISILSSYVALAPGDLIFTGTPAGVGALKKGDIVRASVAGAEPVEIRIAQE